MLGELPINGRPGGRKEEFNPFAKDASAQHKRRKDERDRISATRRPSPISETPPPQPSDIRADLERKQKEAMEKLEQQGDVSANLVAPAPVPQKMVKRQPEKKPQSLSREERLAQLRKKSEDLKNSAPSSPGDTVLKPNIETVSVASPQTVHAKVAEDLDPSIVETITIKSKNRRVNNVFREIETKVENKSDKRKGSRKKVEKKGGGRQKQQKKLDRQKYLEYKYAAKEILDHPQVPEEHRSNILGQIWAKGERIGIEDSLEFIEQKEAELILPSAVGNSLRTLIKEMTTRR